MLNEILVNLYAKNSALRDVRTVSRPGPHLRMLAAGVGALFVHGAAAAALVQQVAVAAGTSSQRENAVPEIEMVDQALAHQAPCNLLGLIVLGFKGIDPTQPDQIGQANLDRHGATIGCTTIAKTPSVKAPGLWTVNVDSGKRLTGSGHRSTGKGQHPVSPC